MWNPSPGEWDFVEKINLSGQSHTFSVPVDAEDLRFEIASGVFISTSNMFIGIRVSTDGGSSYIATNGYTFARVQRQTNENFNTTAAPTGTSGNFVYNVANYNNAGWPVHVSCVMHGPTINGSDKTAIVETIAPSHDSAFESFTKSTVGIPTSAPITNIQILTSNAEGFASGALYVYKRRLTALGVFSPESDPEPPYVEDFCNQYHTGINDHPRGWNYIWGDTDAPITAKVISDPTALKGKCMRVYTSTDDAAREGMVFTKIHQYYKNVFNGELKVRFRLGNINNTTAIYNVFALMVRAHGVVEQAGDNTDTAALLFYKVVENTGKFLAAKYDDTVYTYNSQVDCELIPANTWYWMKAQFDGTRIRGTVWADHASEPMNSWMIDEDMAGIDSFEGSEIGVMVLRSDAFLSHYDIDYFYFSPNLNYDGITPVGGVVEDNFSSYPYSKDTLPAEWTATWRDSSVVTVQVRGGFNSPASHKILVFPLRSDDTLTDYFAIKWNDPGTYPSKANGQALALVSSHNAYPVQRALTGLIVRGAYDGPNLETGILINSEGDLIKIRQYVNGTMTEVSISSQKALPLLEVGWTFIRTVFSGNHFKVKIWPARESEPTEWQVDEVLPQLTLLADGWIGIKPHNTSVDQYLNYIGFSDETTGIIEVPSRPEATFVEDDFSGTADGQPPVNWTDVSTNGGSTGAIVKTMGVPTNSIFADRPNVLRFANTLDFNGYLRWDLVPTSTLAGESLLRFRFRDPIYNIPLGVVHKLDFSSGTTGLYAFVRNEDELQVLSIKNGTAENVLIRAALFANNRQVNNWYWLRTKVLDENSSNSYRTAPIGVKLWPDGIEEPYLWDFQVGALAGHGHGTGVGAFALTPWTEHSVDVDYIAFNDDITTKEIPVPVALNTGFRVLEDYFDDASSSNWFTGWDAANISWSLETDTSSPSGRVLKASTTADVNGYLAWSRITELDSPNDLQTLTCIKWDNVDATIALSAIGNNLSGTSTTRNGFNHFIGGRQHANGAGLWTHLFDFTNGNQASDYRIDPGLVADKWYWIRTSVSAQTASVKIWAFGSTEPLDWQGTDNTLTPAPTGGDTGFVISKIITGNTYHAYFAVSDSPINQGIIPLPDFEEASTRLIEDFSNDAIGQQPINWTKAWNSSDITLDIVRDITSVSGKAMKLSGAVDQRHTVVYDPASDMPDRIEGQVLVGFKFSDVSDNVSGPTLGTIMRMANHEASTPTGVFTSGYSGPDLRVVEYVSSAGSVLGTASFTPEADKWYWIRFDLLHNQIGAKIWERGTEEPGQWSFSDESVMDPSNYALDGDVGVFFNKASWGPYYVDYFAYERYSSYGHIPVPEISDHVTYIVDDFRLEAVGQAPLNWVNTWSTPGLTFSVASHVEAYSGKCMKLGVTATGNNYMEFTPAGVSDGQTLLRLRLDESVTLESYLFGSIFRISGTDVSTDKHAVGGFLMPTDTVAIWEEVVGLGDQQSAVTYEGGKWYWIRTEVDATTAKIKVWGDGSTEPTSWQATDSHTRAAGRVGIYPHRIGMDNSLIDYFAFESDPVTNGDIPVPVYDLVTDSVIEETFEYDNPGELPRHWVDSPIMQGALSYVIEADSSTPGGNRLKINVDTNGENVIKWINPDLGTIDKANGQCLFLFKWTAETQAVSLLAVTRASDEPYTNYTAALSGLADDNKANFAHWLNGSGAWDTSGAPTMTPEDDTWYWLRVDYQGSIAKMSIWKKDNTEPAWPMHQITDMSVVQDGWIGWYHGHTGRHPGYLGYAAYDPNSAVNGNIPIPVQEGGALIEEDFSAIPIGAVPNNFSIGWGIDPGMAVVGDNSAIGGKVLKLDPPDQPNDTGAHAIWENPGIQLGGQVLMRVKVTNSAVAPNSTGITFRLSGDATDDQNYSHAGVGYFSRNTTESICHSWDYLNDGLENGTELAATSSSQMLTGTWSWIRVEVREDNTLRGKVWSGYDEPTEWQLVTGNIPRPLTAGNIAIAAWDRGTPHYVDYIAYQEDPASYGNIPQPVVPSTPEVITNDWELFDIQDNGPGDYCFVEVPPDATDIKIVMHIETQATNASGTYALSVDGGATFLYPQGPSQTGLDATSHMRYPVEGGSNIKALKDAGRFMFDLKSADSYRVNTVSIKMLNVNKANVLKSAYLEVGGNWGDSSGDLCGFWGSNTFDSAQFLQPITNVKLERWPQRSTVYVYKRKGA